MSDNALSMREAAIGMHELYLAYIEAGFTPEQALDLLKVSLMQKPTENE